MQAHRESRMTETDAAGYAERCAPSLLRDLSVGEDRPIFATDPTSGTFETRLQENIPTGRIEAPLLVGQGLADPLVTPAVQRAYVARRCQDGQRLDYRTFPGYDHVGVVGPDSPLIPQLVSWTQDRFDGKPAKDNCDSLP